MKPITLYSTSKQVVQSYDMQFVQQYQYPSLQEAICVRNSDILLDKQEVEVKHLPIERFCWGNEKGMRREIFAAFDEELREIIECSQDKFKRDVQEATDRRVKHQYTQLLAVKYDHQALIELSTWRSMVWAIKKIWRKK